MANSHMSPPSIKTKKGPSSKPNFADFVDPGADDGMI